MIPQQEWEAEVTLGDVSTANAYLDIGETRYRLRRLGPGDSAACEVFLRSTRATAAVEGLRHTSIVSDEVVGQVFSTIMATSFGPSEQWRSSQGTAFLLARGVVEPKLSYDQILNPDGPLKGVAAIQITNALTWMTGTPFDEHGNPVPRDRPDSTDSPPK